MKKFINAVDQVENQMISGMVKAYPSLRKLDCGNVVVRANKKEGKVALVSGGGSGHEPAHGGYVGTGMLDGAVAGAVFTSPTPDQILEAIHAVATDAGVLLVVKNYTGDVMNFEMAEELAQGEGIQVKHVVTNDDVAVKDSLYTVGRRGVAGTIFVHKIAGAKAEAGGSLDEVQAVAQKVIDNVRTMGVALTPCMVPAAGKPGFTLGEDEMEVGIGIHGEPGTHREAVRPADEIVDHLLDRILADIDYAGHEVAVMVNGSGGTPLMELFILNNHGPELIHHKRMIMQSHPLLLVNQRTLGCQLDNNGKNKHHRRSNDNPENAADNIHQSLYCGRKCIRKRDISYVDDRKSENIFCIGFRRNDIVIIFAFLRNLRQYNLSVLVQNNTVNRIAKTIHRLLQHGKPEETLIETQIDMRVLFIHRCKRRKDAELVRDDVLPDVRHLQLQMKELLEVLDFTRLFGALTLIDFVLHIEGQAVFVPLGDGAMDERLVASANGRSVHEGEMHDVQLVFDCAGIMHAPVLGDFAISKSLRELFKKRDFR